MQGWPFAACQKAAELMSGSAVSSIFIRDPGGEPVGIVTDNDLRTKVIARGLNVEKSVAESCLHRSRAFPKMH